jgi:hypothetical protein
MARAPRLKDDYVLARCCSPAPPDRIVGYYSYDKVLKVHRHDCRHLIRVEAARLIKLDWQEIIEPPPKGPGDDFADLDTIDFAVLKHHRQYGIDYSLMLAKMLSIPKKDAFDRHQRLKEAGLLQRVDAVMVRYRKGIVDNKWIKHRNHTYYQLTKKGEQYLAYFVSNIEQDNQREP